MNEPNWLDKDSVLLLHERLIEETGGSHGVRDEALLESALSRAQNLYAYEDADLFDLAAAYAEGLSSNHAFVDGNKRVAYAAAGLFLEDNGYTLEVEQDNEQEELFLRLAKGEVSREVLAEWYRQHTQPLELERDEEAERLTKEAEERAARLAEFERLWKEGEERRQENEQTLSQN
jgi:death-on-curing protein